MKTYHGCLQRSDGTEPARGHHLFLASLTIAFSAVVLLGCGGGSTAETVQPAAANATDKQAAANRVVRVDDGSVSKQGSFVSEPGYLSNSAKVLRSDGKEPATVTLTAAISKRGFYQLFAWWPQAIKDAGDVTVAIGHANGQTSSQLDQRVGGGEWNSLGIFEFDPTTGVSVTFKRGAGGPLVVDSIRLQWIGSTRPGPEVVDGTMPVGLKDRAYEAVIVANGGAAPYRYTVTAGELPPGIELDGASGKLSGIAAKAGTYSFEITLRDANGAESTRQLTIVIGSTAAGREVAEGMGLGMHRARPLSAGAADGTAPDLSGILGVIAAMPEGGWSKVNLNDYSSVWTPPALRPLYNGGILDPSKIILAWSSFAWDTNRAALMLYGGGHANYRGNDVYIWRASTQLWERAALPSEIVPDALGNMMAIDGVAHAPAAAHTYDNTIFFPLVDRVLVLGGAADSNGGQYMTADTATTSRPTGPYLFDMSRASPDKVGGSTGSHVQREGAFPEIVGGNMWSNRESWLNANANSAPPSEPFVNSCTGYAEENGQDVAYVRTQYRLYRYRILDINNPAADRWERVGRYWFGSGYQATCSYDTQRKVLVSTNYNGLPFTYWNMNTAGPTNNEVYFTPSDASGEFAQVMASNTVNLQNCAIEFDAKRADHKLWCGDGRVWTLTPPATLSSNGWTISRFATPSTIVPNGQVGTGILGKWKYVPNLDVFLGLQDPVLGQIWVYKPKGWVNPSNANLAPTVAITSPAAGSTYTFGAPITITADASDSDGSIATVEFYAGTTLVGTASAAPFSVVWGNAAAGTWSLTAVATDNLGARRTSAAVSITVAPPIAPNVPPTVSLTQPGSGTSFSLGSPITITASAADSDGSIAKVEFFAGGNKIGEALAAPYTMTWSNAPLGTASLTAMATDDRAGTTVSAPVSVTVVPAGTSVTLALQRGTFTGAVVRDTYLSSYHTTLNFGTVNEFLDEQSFYTPLLRFAIFQSEGGPVPNGAHIKSAVLSVYKYSAYNVTYSVYRVLQDWSETTATWNQRSPGLPWQSAGANGVGTDYAATADATATVGFDPGWLQFNVTSPVGVMSTAQPSVNFGWRLRATSGVGQLKHLYSSDYAASPTLRPKLVITYD